MSHPDSISSQMRKTAQHGASSLSADSREHILKFVLGQRNSDGGFRGRSDESDLYYTYFAIECLKACGHPIPEMMTEYLNQFQEGSQLDLVHLTCLIRSKVIIKEPPENTMKLLTLKTHGFRTASGGFSLSKEKKTDSIYACFLAWLAHEDIGLRIENTSALTSCIVGLQADDGAFADRPGMTRGTTTVTAAAIALLDRLGHAIEPEILTWLTYRTKHGGFTATPDTPVPDLLSTATTLFALHAVDHPLSLEQPELTFDFIDACWQDDGGFTGHILDTTSDCEYTYYGLLSLGCLAGVESCIV